MKKPPRQRPWSQPLADLVTAAIDPVLARQGFGQSGVILNWDDIAGERLAANSQPVKLQWPPRPAGRRAEAPLQPATLVIRVEGPFAIELQHMSDVLIERINTHLGWRCVGRLQLKQGPLDRLARTRRKRSPLSGPELAAAARFAEGIGSEGLKAALTKLGAHVMARKTPAEG